MEQIGLEAILKDANFQAGLARYTAGLGKAEASTQASASKMSLLSKTTDVLGGAFSNILKISAGAAIGLAGIGTVVGKIGLDFNSMRQQAEISFTTMLGSGEKAKSFLDDLQKFAATTPFEFPELVQAGKSLIAFGFSAEDVIPTMTRLGDISAGIGIPVGELTEIYGKARTQGRLFAEDINQLTGRGIPIVKELAKQFGVNESEIRKMVEDGKVGFPQLEKAFASMTGKGGQFAGLMAAQSQSFSGLMSTLKDTLSIAAGALTKPLFEKLTQGLKQFTDWLSTPEVQTGISDLATKIQSGLERLGPIIAQVASFIGPLLQQFMTDAPVAASSMQTSFNQIKQAVLDAWAIVGPPLQSLLGTLSQFWMEIQPKLSRAWLAISGAIQVATEMISTFIHDHWTEIKEFLDGAWQAIEGAVTIAWSLISGIIKVALDLIGGDFQAAGVDFRAMLEGTWRGIQMLTAGIWQEIQTVVTNALAGLAGAILAKMGEIRASIQGGFESALNWLSGLPDRMKQMAINMLAGFIVGMWQEAGAIAQALSDIINQAIDNLKRLLGIASPSKVFAGIGSQMAQGLAQGFSGVLAGFSPVLNANVAAVPFGGMNSMAGITSPRSVSMPVAPRMQMLSSVSRTLNFNIGSVNGVSDFDYRVRQIVQAHDRGH